MKLIQKLDIEYTVILIKIEVGESLILRSQFTGTRYINDYKIYRTVSYDNGEEVTVNSVEDYNFKISIL
jgi:hypothetical protein